MADRGQLPAQPRRASGNRVRAGYQPASPTMPSLQPATAPSQSTSQSSSLPPLVADVPQSRTCWICLDTDEDERASGQTKEWTHACDCSLVAHEDCLLEWIVEQSRNGTPHCPACNSLYQIKQESSSYLRLYTKVCEKLDNASILVAAGGLVGATWLSLAAHGMWAVRQFAGEQVAQAIAHRHPRWPVRYYINYPLIPITLLLARTPLIDSLLPFIPLTHALTATAPPLFRSASTLPDPLGLDSLALTWPPSPTLTICALPWLRLGYLNLRRRVFAAVLGAKNVPAEGLVGFLAGLIGPVRDAAMAEDRPAGGAGFAGFDAEVDVNVVEEGEGGGARADGQQAGGVVAQPRPGRLRIGMGRFTSVVVGALLAPVLARGAGAALLWLATRKGGHSGMQGLLQKVLGLSAVVAAGKAGAASPWVKLASGMRAAPVDPVWVRNLIGGGLLLIVRDAFELTAGVIQARIASQRRVVGRPFRPSGRASPLPPPNGTTMSGGRDGNGREAVVRASL